MHTHTHAVHDILIALLLSPHHPPTPPLKDSDKYTALICAAAYGHVEAVKSLVAADPDPAHLDMKVSVLSKGVFVVYERERETEECIQTQVETQRQSCIRTIM